MPLHRNVTDPRHHAASTERILRERTQALAARTERADQAPGRRVLACAVGDELVALDIRLVGEILPYSGCVPVMAGHPALLGLYGRTGRLFSVLDLARLLGLMPADSEAGHMLLLRREKPFVALRIDRVLGVVDAEILSATSQGDGERSAIELFLRAPPGSIDTGERILGLLALDRALAPLLSSRPAQPGA